MKSSLKLSALLVAAMALSMAPAYSQARRGGGGSASNGSSSSSSSSSRSSGSSSSSVSRSSGSGSVSRSSGSSTRVSGSSSSGSSVRSGSSSSARYSGGSVSSSPRTSAGSGSSVTRYSGASSSSSAKVRSSSASSSAGSGSGSSRSFSSDGVYRSSGSSSSGSVTRVSGAAVDRSSSKSSSAPRRVAGFEASSTVPSPKYRGMIRYNEPARFYENKAHNYGYRVVNLPRHYECKYYWGRPYYYWDGRYYCQYGNYYYICRPPYGTLFDIAMYSMEAVACSFAYYNTLYDYYKVADDNYKLIQDQNRLISHNNAMLLQQQAQLAEGNADILAQNKVKEELSHELAKKLGLVQSYALGEKQYFYNEGIFFQMSSDGKYETVVPPAGALVESLPEDYEKISLEGMDFYRVDDTIYKMSVKDGKPVFEVLGQLPAELYAQYLD